jgi:hypothetical protein
MAYTSDLRVKNLIKSIHLDVIEDLTKLGVENNLHLRIFDESKEDSLPWEKGGLTFKDTRVDLTLGSNDAGWYIEKEGKIVPLVIVEGTFGTERGQFGDGQLNRFSHALGPAINGCIGVLFCPFKGESFVKTPEEDFHFKIQYAHLRKDIVKAALKITKVEKGFYFTIDTYNPEILKDLVLNSYLENIGEKNTLNEIKTKIITKMEKFVEGTKRGYSNQILEKVYLENGTISEKYTGRMFTHNIAALTTSQKRDGHGLLGKNLIETYLIETEMLLCIFIRLSKENIDLLKTRRSKEFTYLLNNPMIKVLCFDDLLFDDADIKEKLSSLREENLLMNSQKSFIKELKQLFEEGKIRIKE